MKKFYFLFISVTLASFLSAQCVIDTTMLNGVPGMYPTAAHLPHAVRDSLYDQTVQGKIPDTLNMNFGGFISISIRVDSVRLDSINGLPVGINWVRNPDVLRGGGYGCVEFTGTASDTAGTYNLRAVGMVWAHLSVPLLGINTDTFQYGSLNRIPPFNSYFLVVDSAPAPLSVTAVSSKLCFGAGNTGVATATAHGGSPLTPYTYAWTTGSTHYRIDSLASGAYTVTVTSGSETATISVNIDEQPSPLATTITATGSTGSDGTASVAVTGGVSPYTYFWTNGGGSTSVIDSLPPGTYRVTVRDSFGCVVRDTAIVENLISGISPITVGAPVLRLFPNPANTVINVWIESSENFSPKFELIDVAGRIIHSFPVSDSGKLNQELDLTLFCPGIYILRATSANLSLHQRFVINH